MAPHNRFWDCPKCDKFFQDKNCFAKGKYCGKDSSYYVKSSGREIMLEELRHLCIYKESYFQDGERTQWWDYVLNYHRLCFGLVNEDCSIQAHMVSKLNFTKTMKCVAKSFSLNGQSVKLEDESAMNDPNLKNKVIDNEIDYYSKYGPHTTPAIVVNNQTFRGQLEVEAVFNAICAGFKDTPRFCRKFLETNDVNDPNLILMMHKKHSYGRVLGICTGLMTFILMMLYCYRRSAKRAMKQQLKESVVSSVNQYLALRNNDREAGDRAMQSEMMTKN
jgi:hypothetical protein